MATITKSGRPGRPKGTKRGFGPKHTIAFDSQQDTSMCKAATAFGMDFTEMIRTWCGVVDWAAVAKEADRSRRYQHSYVIDLIQQHTINGNDRPDSR